MHVSVSRTSFGTRLCVIWREENIACNAGLVCNHFFFTMAGMTVLLKVSSVKLYEDDGNGLWKDCSPNPCVLVVTRNPQGLSCSILDKSTRQPCFNRWLTPKVAITHDREDWIGWSEPTKEGLKAFGIKMKPAECVQFVDLIATQLSKSSPRSSVASPRTESSNPTPAPNHGEAAPEQSSSASISSSTISARPVSIGFPAQQMPQSIQFANEGASVADVRQPSSSVSSPGDEDAAASPRIEQNAMALKIMEQKKRLLALKQSKDEDLEREKALLELAKQGARAEEVVPTNTGAKKPITHSKRKSMVDAAAFAAEFKLRSTAADFAALSINMDDQVWVENDIEGFVAYRISQRGLTSVVLSPVDSNSASNQTLSLSHKEFEALYRVSSFNPEQTSDISMLGESVSEPLVLAVLRERHRQKLVFTMLSDMLISINPFADVQLYTTRIMENYIRSSSETLPPHAFGLASNALRLLVQQREPQNIVICGEQSSGKTETSKILMKFFGGVSGTSSIISQKLQCASFLLDSFGNAATHRNENSSRFSKCVHKL